MSQLMLMTDVGLFAENHYSILSVEWYYFYKTNWFNWITWLTSIIVMVIGKTKFVVQSPLGANKSVLMDFVLNCAFIVRVSMTMLMCSGVLFGIPRFSIPLILLFGTIAFLVNLGNLLRRAG